MKENTVKEKAEAIPTATQVEDSKPVETATCPHVYVAISNITRQLKGVAKNGKNLTQKFSYRAAADIMDALSPLLAQEGIIIIPRVKEQNTVREEGERNITIITTVTMNFEVRSSRDGSFFEVPICAQAYDYSDKGMYKCYTFAWKNMVQILFAITIEADPDSDDIKRPPKPVEEDRSGKVIEQLVAMATKYKISVKLLAAELGAVSAEPKTLTCLSLKAIEDTAKKLSDGTKLLWA